MKTVKLLLLLLIPAALFFASCQNELPEEMMIELASDSPDMGWTLDDIEYFLLTLDKFYDIPGDGDFVGKEDKPIIQNQKLSKGETLVLEGLEPGYYRLYGGAFSVNNYCGPVEGKTEKMKRVHYQTPLVQVPINYDCIVLDGFSPAVIKLEVRWETQKM